MKFNKTASAAIAITAILGLSACGGEQSVAEACKVASTTMLAAESEITDSMAGVSTGDFAGVVEGFKALSSTLNEADSKITNAEVKGALGDFNTSIQEFSKLFEGVTDGDVTALAEKATEMEAISVKMTESSTKLSELCPAG